MQGRHVDCHCCCRTSCTQHMQPATNSSLMTKVTVQNHKVRLHGRLYTHRERQQLYYKSIFQKIQYIIHKTWNKVEPSRCQILALNIPNFNLCSTAKHQLLDRCPKASNRPKWTYGKPWLRLMVAWALAFLWLTLWFCGDWMVPPQIPMPDK